MLNENIQALRKSKGFSQEELALKLNVVKADGLTAYASRFSYSKVPF